VAKATPLTRQERQQITDLHAQGWSLSRIAAHLERSKSTVGKAAKAAGLQWTSTRTALATEAKVQSNREKRATLEGRFLDEAGLLLDQLHKPHTVFNFGGKDNTYEERELPEPDVGAKRSLIQAATTAVGQAIKLAEVDRATTGAGEARGILGAFAAGLQQAYDSLPAAPAAEQEDDGTGGQPPAGEG
jgi:hypothetical protein